MSGVILSITLSRGLGRTVELVKPGNEVTSLIFSLFIYIYFSAWLPWPHSGLLYVFRKDHTLCYGDGPPFPILF